MKRYKKRGLSQIEGLPVINLNKKIRFSITEQDCKLGKSKAPDACAGALALRRIPHCVEARVHIGRVFLKMKGKNGKLHWLRGKTPGGLRTEIAAFDRGGTFEPGDYDVNPLSKSERPTGKRRGDVPKLKHGRKGFERLRPRVLTKVRGGGRSEYSHLK